MWSYIRIVYGGTVRGAVAADQWMTAQMSVFPRISGDYLIITLIHDNFEYCLVSENK